MTERMEGYLRYIDSEHWTKLRNYKVALIGQCQNCKAKNSLHVHHVDYKDYYSCTVDDLVVLCVMCHNDLHDALRMIKAKPIDYPLPMIGPLLVRYRSGELGKTRKAERQKNRVVRRQRYRKEISRIVNNFWRSERKVQDLINMRDALSVLIDASQINLSRVILEHDAEAVTAG